MGKKTRCLADRGEYRKILLSIRLFIVTYITVLLLNKENVILDELKLVWVSCLGLKLLRKRDLTIYSNCVHYSYDNEYSQNFNTERISSAFFLLSMHHSN